jgi:hypothetical protein
MQIQKPNDFLVVVKHNSGICARFDVSEDTTIKKIREMAIENFKCSEKWFFMLLGQGKYIGKNPTNKKPEITDKHTVKELYKKHPGTRYLFLTKIF